MSSNGWIAVDLDGTLAHYEGWKGGSIGAPVPLMVERVRRWIAAGEDVRIFTARVSSGEPGVREAIRAWCLEHIGAVLPITNIKDFAMKQLWDDRAVQVIPNTGLRADGEL